MQSNTDTRGVKAGGLKGSKWASGSDTCAGTANRPSAHPPSAPAPSPSSPSTQVAPSDPSRGPSSFNPRSPRRRKRRSSASARNDRDRDSSAIVPAAPQPEPEPWWENTPAPKMRGASEEDINNSPNPPFAPRPSYGVSLTTSQRELRRYVQIVRRMKWKLPYLQDGYRRAIGPKKEPVTTSWADAVEEDEEEADLDADAHRAVEREKERQEAELMFKLDFFEFYMLLERALVHLLGIFGVSISRGGAPGGASGTNGSGRGDGKVKERGIGCATGKAADDGQGDKDGGIGASKHNSNNGGAAHSYHQNVLSALEAPDNPLHAALGTGEVRRHLGRAKELRNRWKYAEDTSASRMEEANARHAARNERSDQRPATGRAPLESYDLNSMFGHVFAGFDQGYLVAEEWVAELARRADTVPAAGSNTGSGSKLGPEGAVVSAAAEGHMSHVEEDFDFMVDAMDWEAV